MTRVLVADDQLLIRAGLVGLLRAAPGVEVVGEAGDGAEAVALAAETRPDVVLMDIRMPGMSGIVATREILAAACEPPPRILMLTTFDLDEYVYGASGRALPASCSRTRAPSGCWRPSRRSAGETPCSRRASRDAWWRRSPGGPASAGRLHRLPSSAP